ncbi:MAG: uroporphyrinogen-III C-methyltransferase [Microcystaceae cyanobacterium]
MSGKVYLVGAGIGNINYLTIQAQTLLSQADILIYDDLIDPSLLNLVPTHCLKIYAGKRGGQTSTPQPQINQWLVAYCQQGHQVIRLKSGDPFIFGRSEPEITALTQENCDYEVITGISSALAAPSLAGIPLTHKTLSRHFTVLSGHNCDRLDWSALGNIDTLVILMGGGSLPQIIAYLEENGRLPTTPIAIIRHAGRPQQQIWIGTLGDIVDQVKGIRLSPAVIIIGQVVTLRKSMPTLPLTGKTILVTRAAEQSSKLTQLLQEKGAYVLEMPALEIVPPSTWQRLDQAILEITTFDWLILTSANGVNYFFERLATFGKDSRSLAHLKVAVVGKKTASVLQKYGISADFIPPNFVADSLVETFPERLQGLKILFPRVETGGRDVLCQELSQQKANLVEVPAYQSVCPSDIPENVWQALQNQQINIITFASSKTVQNFVNLLQQKLEKNTALILDKFLASVLIASIGPQTSRSCQELLRKVDIEAKEYTLEGLTEAIILGK